MHAGGNGCDDLRKKRLDAMRVCIRSHRVYVSEVGGEEEERSGEKDITIWKRSILSARCARSKDVYTLFGGWGPPGAPSGPSGPQSSSPPPPPPLLFFTWVFHSLPMAELIPCEDDGGEIGEMARDRGGIGSARPGDKGPKASNWGGG